MTDALRCAWLYALVMPISHLVSGSFYSISIIIIIIIVSHSFLSCPVGACSIQTCIGNRESSVEWLQGQALRNSPVRACGRWLVCLRTRKMEGVTTIPGFHVAQDLRGPASQNPFPNNGT
jgi:hypothetical protein